MKSLNSRNVKERKVIEEILQKAYERFIGDPLSDTDFVGPFPPPLIIDFIISGPDDDQKEED
jgi:hypothetical protein